MKRFVSLTLLVISSMAIAQNGNPLWRSNTATSKAKTASGVILPKKNLYDLDLNALHKALMNSPKRMFNAQKSNTLITLPNAEGTFEAFRVSENPVMDPALAARYPEIKSYVAVSVENPGTRVYFSISPLGFKSMTLNPGKPSVFIEPVSTDMKTYTVYSKSDYKTALSTIECRVIDQAVSTIDNSAFLRPNADDAKLRTFRLALSCTGEYTTYFGGTKALALAAMNNTLTRCNGIFETDFGVRLVLIATNDNVIYTNAATDPYADAASMSSWNSQLQSNLTAVIGEANYDIGHLLGASGGGGNAGCIGCVCIDGQKGSGYTSPSSGIPSGDNFDIDYVAHEMGHQLGANHTYTHVTESGTGAQMEPGSGSTIMSYAGITTKDIQRHSDPYFHAISIQQVTNNIKAKTCPTLTSTGNAIPSVNAGLDYTIPKGTPFMLTGTASDANGDILTYDWEEMDLGSATTATPTATATLGPIFRSYPPTTSPTRYFPRMATVLSGLTTTAGTEIPWEVLPTVGRPLNFRLTVRDNRAGGPANNSDDAIVTVNETAGPFTVSIPNTAVSYSGGSTQSITWNVAGTTANGVNCASVDILLSTDGGLTFSTTLISGTANDGFENVVIPNLAGTANRIMVKGNNHIFFDVSDTNFTITNGTAVVDTVPPTVITTLTASGTTAVSTNLSWTPTTDNIGVTSYEVYQNGIWKVSTTSITLHVTGLLSAVTYSYYVIAKDAAGNVSPTSNIANVITLSAIDTTAPSTTTLTALGTTTTSTNLSWAAASDNVGVTGYNVYQNGALRASVTGTTYTASGLSASTTYTFYVVARDAAGNTSAASNIANATTLSAADITAPSATTLTTSGTTTTSTNLSWAAASDNVGVTGYNIYQNGVLRASATGTNYTASGLSASTAYNFYVVARDAAGNTSAASNIANATTLSVGDTTAPSATTLNTSGTTTTSTNLSWAAASDNVAVTGYNIYQNGVLRASATGTTYTASGLSASTTYTFYVVAKDAAGNTSSASNTVSVTTLTTVMAYCTSNGIGREYINGVQLGSIDNVSGNNGGYGNFTSMSTNLTIGTSNQVFITPASTSSMFSGAYRIWIDFNQDGDFSDSGEEVLSQSKTKTRQISGSIFVPTTAALGATRMRVSMKYNTAPTACESFSYGEVEDYTVVITTTPSKMDEEEVIAKMDFKLYPNPVTGEVLNISSSDTLTEFRIFDMMGKELIKNHLENESVYVGTLPSGIYLIEVTDGSSTKSKRFIKQ
ncbi:reprolysin-like metallopeptidase [Flavobacterium sp.]|uniref:reprolysin-like metallopeptidase n=1 Tax=Flavobacterium sp. TaxID=239 RepID=UPI0025FA523E|nr:zinc-dependent metalloprotease family protein [Flavobacterium sp.]